MEVDILKSYIKELRNGSYKAFNVLYEMYADRLYGFAFAHTKSRELSNDIVQETFLKLWLKRETISVEGSFQSFLFTITYNKLIDTFRSQINKIEFEDYIVYLDNNKLSESKTDQQLMYDDFLKALKACKNSLTNRQLEIFELSREKGKSIEQIANGLNISEQTVKNQLTSALKILRTELYRYNIIFFLLFDLVY
jgi:RNA polymerase sigma-70 factor (family 1)